MVKRVDCQKTDMKHKIPCFYRKSSRCERLRLVALKKKQKNQEAQAEKLGNVRAKIKIYFHAAFISSEQPMIL